MRGSQDLISPDLLFLGAIVENDGDRVWCSVIRDPDDCGGLLTRFEFTRRPGIRWCVDQPYGRLVSRDEYTAEERVRVVLYRGPRGFAEPWDHECGWTDDEYREMLERRYECALLQAVLGWEAYSALEDQYGVRLGHWDMWVELARRIEGDAASLKVAREVAQDSVSLRAAQEAVSAALKGLIDGSTK